MQTRQHSCASYRATMRDFTTFAHASYYIQTPQTHLVARTASGRSTPGTSTTARPWWTTFRVAARSSGNTSSPKCAPQGVEDGRGRT